MELINKAKNIVKAGRRNDKFVEYSKIYNEISGNKYHSKCTSCACRYLYNYIKMWYEQNK